MELTLVVPALVMMMALLVAGGRLWFARATVADSAYAAARAGSLARSAGAARTDAEAAGRRASATSGLRCAELRTSVDTAAFAVPVGTPATVRAEVTCVVPFGDLLLPGMPGSITVRATGSAALDTYRARS